LPANSSCQPGMPMYSSNVLMDMGEAITLPLKTTRITSAFSIAKASISEKYGQTTLLESSADHSSFRCLRAWSFKACSPYIDNSLGSKLTRTAITQVLFLLWATRRHIQFSLSATRLTQYRQSEGMSKLGWFPIFISVI
jgi:hypothetical protein